MMENKYVPMCQKDQFAKIPLTKKNLKNLQGELTAVTYHGPQHFLDTCFPVFPTSQKADLIHSSGTKYLEHILMFKKYFSGMS